MSFRTPYIKNDRVTFKSQLPSRTLQNFKAESEIDNIMRRYEKTGIIEHQARFQGRYGDFTNAPDYMTAMNKVVAANEMFLTLPSKIRKQFDNDPAQFIDFVSNPENGPELVKMGLATARVEPSTAQPSPLEAGAGAVGGSTTQDTKDVPTA